MTEINNAKPAPSIHPIATQAAAPGAAGSGSQSPEAPHTPSTVDRPAARRSTGEASRHEAGPAHALARPGSKRKVARPKGAPKQASVVTFSDGDEAVVLPTFARGSFAKVSSAALVEGAAAPQVVRKQRTYARVAHDAAKLLRRIDAAVKDKLLTPHEGEMLRVDADALSKLHHLKRKLSLPELRAILANPRHLDTLVAKGRMDAETAIDLRVRHTERRAADLAARTQDRLKALARLPRLAPVVAEPSDVDVDGRWEAADALDRHGVLMSAEAARLKLNPAAVQELHDAGILSKADHDKLLKNPWYLAMLYQRGTVNGAQVVALRDTSAYEQKIIQRWQRRLHALGQLQITTEYRAASETAEERRLLSRVDSPLLPSKVAVVNGMEYELVKRFDGDARTLFNKPLSAADRVALVRALGLHVTTELANAHQSGVAHLDMKGDNVLVDSRAGVFVVGDWGLASEFKGDAPMHGRCGTPQYMAPEVLGNAPYGPAADVYSAGVMLWEGAVSEHVFRSARTSAAQNERKLLEKLLTDCADAQGQVDLARLSTLTDAASPLLVHLQAWHALDPELANLAANHMLRLRPADRLSTHALVPRLQALMSPKTALRAQEALALHAPAAKPLAAELVAATLDKA